MPWNVTMRRQNSVKRDTVTARRWRVFVYPCSGSASGIVFLFSRHHVSIHTQTYACAFGWALLRKIDFFIFFVEQWWATSNSMCVCACIWEIVSFGNHPVQKSQGSEFHEHVSRKEISHKKQRFYRRVWCFVFRFEVARNDLVIGHLLCGELRNTQEWFCVFSVYAQHWWATSTSMCAHAFERLFHLQITKSRSLKAESFTSMFHVKKSRSRSKDSIDAFDVLFFALRLQGIIMLNCK